MSLDPQTSSWQGPALLQSCLVDGDPYQREHERRVRRRALATSIIVEASLLAAVLLIPLFAKPVRLITALATPIPPYRHVAVRSEDGARTAIRKRVCTTCFDSRPVNPAENSHVEPTATVDPAFDSASAGVPGIPCEAAGCIDVNTAGPQRPVPATEVRHDKRPVVVTHIDPAMLVHRVEPVYPTLAKQMGRSGRVELRAVIATDGTIQSLQVVSGDRLFHQSAIEAVRQWRYRPTVLNGEPVEIDTFISVIYNVNR